MSFVQMLRAETAEDHAMVDARFGGFRLDDVGVYRRFLLAHAVALPAVETILATESDLPAWRSRSDALADDLLGLDSAMPAPLAFDLPEGAARWGALYVIEGSRLGGQMLARSVPAGRPVAYLSAKHRAGEWRALLAAIDARAAAAGEPWRTAALAGARATFDLYARAALADTGRA